MLAHEESTFLKVIESADGLDIEFGDVPTFDNTALIGTGAIGLELAVGKKVMTIELAADYERYGDLERILTYSARVSYQIR